MNHEQIEELIKVQIADAVNILDMLAGLPQGTTNHAHRVLIEKIVNAALLQTLLTQAKAVSVQTGGE